MVHPVGRGDADSQFALSDLLARGRGCHRNGESAQRWLLAAADGGQPAALAKVKEAEMKQARVHSGSAEDASRGPAPPVSAMVGYFANRDGWYGHGDFVEYVRVEGDADGRLAAVKVVGDNNIPRRHVTWRTAAGQARATTWVMPIQLHLRDAANDPHGVWWSPLQNYGGHAIEWQPASQPASTQLNAFDIVGTSPNGMHRGRFHRVAEAVALEAARLYTDAP